MRVLIAEDSAMGLLLLQRAVEALGHICIVATDGLTAWELFESENPDVVISDWMMPGLEGPELCRRVRSRTDAPYVYFVFLTVFREKEHALVGIQAGADRLPDQAARPARSQICLIAAERVISVHRRPRPEDRRIGAGQPRAVRERPHRSPHPRRESGCACTKTWTSLTVGWRATGTLTPWPCATSTISRPTTMRSGTRPVTPPCASSPTSSSASAATAMRSTATAARSSSSSCRSSR